MTDLKKTNLPIPWDYALITDALSREEVDRLVTCSPKYPDKTLVMIAHDVPTGTIEVAEKHKKLRQWANQHGLVHRYGEGVRRGDVS